MKITKDSVRVLMNDAHVLMMELAKKHGVKVSAPRAAYDPRMGNMKIRFEFSGENSDGKANEMAEFEALAPLYGMKPQHYRSEMDVMGETYRLVGFRPRSSKRPALLERKTDGRLFTFPVRALAALLPQQDRETFLARHSAVPNFQ